MRPEDVLAFVHARSESQLAADSARYWRRGAAIRVRPDGMWELDRTHDAVRSARQAVRERMAMVRRWADRRPDPAIIAATRERLERERAGHAERLARVRRVVVHAFPAANPAAVVLLDVGRRAITTFMGEEVAGVGKKLADYGIIAGVDVRALLRCLDRKSVV